MDLPVGEYVHLVNDPRPSSPMGQTFTVDYAFWDTGLYELPSVYDTAFDLDKSARLATTKAR